MMKLRVPAAMLALQSKMLSSEQCVDEPTIEMNGSPFEDSNAWRNFETSSGIFPGISVPNKI